MKGPFVKQDAAEKEFVKKFKDKTRNNWEDRESFTAVAGKYTLLDMAESDEEEVGCINITELLRSKLPLNFIGNCQIILIEFSQNAEICSI